MENTSVKKTENPTVIDLSATVLLRRYLGFWRRVSSVALLMCLIGLFLHPSAFWLILLTGSGLAYFIVRYPTRWSIWCWTWLWMFAAPAIGVLFVWELVEVLRDEFTAGLLVPF